jgi:oxaloacetate decarboxylase alpha subunit
VLTGERYKSIAKETAGVLKGEYGASPAPVNEELQARVLEDGQEAITCRPADLLDPEVDKLTAELETIAQEKKIDLADDIIDDVLTYALFPQVGLKFLENRNNPDAFEPAPGTADPTPEPAAPAVAPAASGGAEAYTVQVNGKSYDVTVSAGGAVSSVTPAAAPAAAAPAPAPAAGGTTIAAPLTGNIFKINVSEGQSVAEGDVVMILEAMKMETEVRAACGGTVASIAVKEGDSVHVGDALIVLG